MAEREENGEMISGTTCSARIVEACIRLHNVLVDLQDDTEILPVVDPDVVPGNVTEPNNDTPVVVGADAQARRNCIRDFLAARHNLDI